MGGPRTDRGQLWVVRGWRGWQLVCTGRAGLLCGAAQLTRGGLSWVVLGGVGRGNTPATPTRLPQDNGHLQGFPRPSARQNQQKGSRGQAASPSSESAHRHACGWATVLSCEPWRRPVRQHPHERCLPTHDASRKHSTRHRTRPVSMCRTKEGYACCSPTLAAVGAALLAVLAGGLGVASWAVPHALRRALDAGVHKSFTYEEGSSIFPVWKSDLSADAPTVHFYMWGGRIGIGFNFREQTWPAMPHAGMFST